MGRRGEAPTRRQPEEPSVLRGSLADDVRSTARFGAGQKAVTALGEAVSLLEHDRAEEAIERALEAKRLAPRSGAVREVLGMALYRAGRFREALRELHAYRRITGRVDQNHLIADCHRALGAPQRAVEEARDALRSPAVPDEARAESAIIAASALADLGRHDEALAVLRSFPTREDVARPFDLRLWYVAGDILERAGRPREAAREFQRVLRHDPTAFDTAERLENLA